MSGTESHTYTYGNSEWRDLLTKYDGTTISYDTNGNPTSYYNGSSYTMAWKNGRQLSSVTTGGTTTTYTYDATGVRDSKTVGSTTYKFYTANGQVGRQSGNGKNWTFFYDNQGRPNALIYDNAVYYYVLNLQGDVIGLINTSGTYVAQYAYDAWGKVISSSGTLADINPLRYRGYYYDSETGFYYLGSRYYDPAIKRFINADNETVVITNTASISDKNLFSYCDNNPVVRKDSSGKAWETAFDIISLGSSVADVVLNPVDPWAWASLIGDAIDVAIPFIGGVGEVVRCCGTISKADNVIDAAKQVKKAVSNSTGTYEIMYKSGKNYVGKGSFNRAIQSAQRFSSPHKLNNGLGDEVVSITWKKAKNHREAYMCEYLWQSKGRGVLSTNRNATTYNSIWSPGRRYLGWH